MSEKSEVSVKILEPLRLAFEITGSQPVYSQSKEGPVFAGFQVAFAPIVVSPADFLRLAALKPFRVLVDVVERPE